MYSGNASQLVFGGLAKGQHYSVKRGELLNSLSGMLALGKSPSRRLVIHPHPNVPTGAAEQGPSHAFAKKKKRD